MFIKNIFVYGPEGYLLVNFYVIFLYGLFSVLCWPHKMSFVIPSLYFLKEFMYGCDYFFCESILYWDLLCVRNVLIMDLISLKIF